MNDLPVGLQAVIAARRGVKKSRGMPLNRDSVSTKKAGLMSNTNPTKKKNPPDISGTRSRAYNTRLPEDKTTLGNNSGSRQKSIVNARKKGGLIGMPNNAAGIDYQKGNWVDNKGRTFATAKTEDSKPTLLQKAARAKRLKSKGG